MTTAAAWIVCSIAALAAPGAYGVLESISGQPDCAAAAGNGPLTVGIDATGNVSVCRWPGPTAPNHVYYDGAVSPNPGLMWAAYGGASLRDLPRRDAGSVHVKMDGGAAPIVTITYDTMGATESVFVHPERDLAVFRLEFAAAPPDAVVWYADFSPCTAPMLALPSSERLFPARRDMLAFASNNTVYHARTTGASSRVWDDVDAWLEHGTEPVWFKKGGGVWIGYMSAGPSGGTICSGETGDTSTMALADAGRWNDRTKAAGACASAMKVPVDPETKSATVLVAFAETRADVDDALAGAVKLGHAELLDETQKWWKDKLAGLGRPTNAPDSVLAQYDRALRTLLTSIDKPSGAVARAAMSRPALAVDTPRLAAWTTLALDLASDPADATRHLQFLARAVRTTELPGAPAGSLPAAVYGTGMDAAPQAVLDVTAPAWFLWSAWRHQEYVPEPERERCRADVWKSVERAGDFVSSWCRAARDTPVFSYDPVRLSDAASIETIAAAYAGLRAAGAFAQAEGKDKAEWAERAQDLEEYLRFHALDSAGGFTIANPLVLWPTGLVPSFDPHWTAPVQAALDRIQSGAQANSIEALAQLCLLLHDRSDMLPELQRHAEGAIARALDAYPCDSYYAALAIVVARMAYPGGGA